MKKTNKIFLSLGTAAIATVSAVTPLVSCSEESKKQYKPQDLELKDIGKGIASKDYAANDYAKLKDLAFSLTKGSINKSVRIISSKIADSLKKLEIKDIVDAFKILIQKGLNVKKSELAPVKKIVGLFVSENKALKINYFIDLAVGAISSTNIKDYIKIQGGILKLIQKIVASIPGELKSLFDALEYGVSNKTFAQLIGDTFNAIKKLLGSDEKTAVGLNSSPSNDSFRKIVETQILIPGNGFINKNNRKINEKIREYETIQASSSSSYDSRKKAKEYMILSHLKATTDAFNSNKEKAYIKGQETVPLLKGKGLLNHSTETELTQNIIYLQFQLQKILLYFGLPTWNRSSSKWELETDKVFEKMEALIPGQASKIEKFKAKMRSIFLEKKLWLFASKDLSKLTPFLHLMFQNRIIDTAITEQVKDKLNDFIEFIMEMEGKAPISFNLEESKTLFKLMKGGLKIVNNSDADKKQAKTIVGKFLKPFLSRVALVAVKRLLNTMLFGVSETQNS